MSERLSIVIPVYNEGASFPSLWAELCSQVRAPFTAFVVYDFDEDNTVPAAQEIIRQGETRLRLVKNQLCRGVVGAILTGFNLIEHGPVLVLMGDLSDDLAQIGRMLALYRQGYRVVVGSRYMKGGSVEPGPRLKQFLSRAAGLTLHWFRGLPTHDATNAFKIYDRDLLRRFTIESQHGFELNLELTVKAFLAGARMTEVPCQWQERTTGRSRFRLWAWLPHYLKWYFYAFRPRRRTTGRAHSEHATQV